MKGILGPGPFFGWSLNGSLWERPRERGKLELEGSGQVCRPGSLGRWGSVTGFENPGRRGSPEPEERKRDRSPDRRARPHLPTPSTNDPVSEARLRLPALWAPSLGLMGRWWPNPATSWACQRPGSRSLAGRPPVLAERASLESQGTLRERRRTKAKFDSAGWSNRKPLSIRSPIRVSSAPLLRGLRNRRPLAG